MSHTKSLPREVWIKFRPYLRDFLVDWLKLVSLWGSLFAFKLLTHFIAIDGWAGNWITKIHSSGVILAYGLLGVLFALTVWKNR